MESEKRPLARQQSSVTMLVESGKIFGLEVASHSNATTPSRTHQQGGLLSSGLTLTPDDRGRPSSSPSHHPQHTLEMEVGFNAQTGRAGAPM